MVVKDCFIEASAVPNRTKWGEVCDGPFGWMTFTARWLENNESVCVELGLSRGEILEKFLL